MSGSGACRDNLDSWLDDAEIDAPASQETPKDYIWHGDIYHLKDTPCNRCPQETPAQHSPLPGM